MFLQIDNDAILKSTGGTPNEENSINKTRYCSSKPIFKSESNVSCPGHVP